MNTQSNHDDIIDAEFIVDESQSPSSKQSNGAPKNESQSIHPFEFRPYENQSNQGFSSQTFAWNFGKKKGALLPKTNLLVLFLLSPILIVLFLFAAVIFLVVFVLFMPKIIKMVRGKGPIFGAQNEAFKNMFNQRRRP